MTVHIPYRVKNKEKRLIIPCVGLNGNILKDRKSISLITNLAYSFDVMLL